MKPASAPSPPCVQAWIQPLSDDPAAVSAAAIARTRLPGGAALTSLRRMRVVELRGALPEGARVLDLLHESSQFYNPFKERCLLRSHSEDPAPIDAAEVAVLVSERDGERRSSAERWWLHRTGEAIEVREAIAWCMAFESSSAAETLALADSLALLRGRASGLLCNPHSQDLRPAVRRPPVPWIA